MESFSTHGMPAARKVAFWNEVTSDTFAALEIKPRDITHFDGTLVRERAGPVTLMEVTSSSVRVQHTREHIARTPSPSYLLLAPLQREFELRLPNAVGVTVRTGEFCLIDHARPYELVHGDGVRTLCVDVPRQRFEERVANPAQVVGRVMQPDNALARTLTTLLRGLGAELDRARPAGFSPAFGHSLLGFVAAAYEAHCFERLERGAAARARSLRAYIDSRHTDADLTPAEIAQRFEISERYVRAVLRADGESFSEYLLRVRLERCAARLVDPEWQSRTITAIAFEAGFSNATHFGHAFKNRYGLTPSEYRNPRAQRLDSPATKQLGNEP